MNDYNNHQPEWQQFRAITAADWSRGLKASRERRATVSQRHPTHNQLKKAVMKKPKKYDLELWNSMYPVGSPCVLTLDNGQELTTSTRSEAWELGHGQAVVSVEGKTGGWMLERVRMLETHSATPRP